jgi:hypothetical protein
LLQQGPGSNRISLLAGVGVAGFASQISLLAGVGVAGFASWLYNGDQY